MSMITKRVFVSDSNQISDNVIKTNHIDILDYVRVNELRIYDQAKSAHKASINYTDADNHLNFARSNDTGVIADAFDISQSTTGAPMNIRSRVSSLSMGSKKITNLAQGSNSGDAAAVGLNSVKRVLKESVSWNISVDTSYETSILSFNSNTFPSAYLRSALSRNTIYQRLKVYVFSNPISGVSTIALANNGVDTVLSVSIPGLLTGLFENVTNSYNGAIGDSLSLTMRGGSGTAGPLSVRYAEIEEVEYIT